MTNRSGVFLLSIVLGAAATGFGCDSGSSGSDTTMTTVLDDAQRHHLGLNVRPEYVMPTPEGLERSYSFSLAVRPAAGSISVAIYDMDNYGAEIKVNGATVRTLPPPNGDAQVAFDVDGSSFVTGANTISLHSRGSGSEYEDFEYSDLLVQVDYSGTVE